MAYETPTTNPDVIRHWEFFKKALENTFRLGGLWDEFNISIREYDFNNNPNPYKVFITGKTSRLEKTHSLLLEFLANESNNSLYFKLSQVGSLGVHWSKKGKAFTDNENNASLIFEVCDFLYAEYKGFYDAFISAEDATIKRDEHYAKIINNMIELSGNHLEGSCSQGVADLRIKNNEKHKWLQFYGVSEGDSLKFGIDIKDATPEQAAKIAKILAESD